MTGQVSGAHLSGVSLSRITEEALLAGDKTQVIALTTQSGLTEISRSTTRKPQSLRSSIEAYPRDEFLITRSCTED